MDQRHLLRRLELLESEMAELRSQLGNLPTRIAPPRALLYQPVLAKIKGKFPGGGCYTAWQVTGPANQAGADAQAGSNLAMPEGMEVAASDDVSTLVNLAESGSAVHLLSNNGFVVAFRIARDHTANNDVLAVAGPPPGALWVVTLSNDGGANGNKTTAATWTYTAASMDGATLGHAMTPQVPRPNGTRPAATLGLAYIDGASTFRLLYAFEIPGTGGCG